MSTKRFEREIKLVASLAAGAVVVAGAYVLGAVLQKWEPGGPEAWGQLGDYVGGLLNPLVGIATVVLVVRTLQHSRDEASSTREELQKQLMAMEKQHALSEMQKRLDGVIEVWARVLDRNAGRPSFCNADRASIVTARDDVTFREALEGRYWGACFAHGAESQFREQLTIGWWQQFFEPAAVLHELAGYCREYQHAAGNRIVADFYRRRVALAARTLRTMQLIDEAAYEDLRPAREVHAAPKRGSESTFVPSTA